MTNNDEDTSRQAESLWRSDDWADLRWAREHSTPQQIARHLLDPQWRNRDYNALDELVEMTHDADLSSLSEDDLETLAASSLPELRQSVIRYKDTPARLLEDMARTESNTRLLQMSNRADSARTPSTCAVGTRRTADWRRACCRRPQTICWSG